MIELAEGTSRKETWAHTLSIAAKEGKEELLAMLLDHKEPSQKGSQKASSQGKAANRQQKGSSISQKAITKNNSVGQQDSRFETTITAEGPESSEGEQLQARIASLVSKEYRDMVINREDDEKRTPLSWAVSKGYGKAVDVLLRNHAGLEVANKDGKRPINLAAENDDEEVTRLLIERGANIEAANHDKLTPLNSAAKSGHVKVVKLLLEKGANIETTSEYGWTPLNSAADSGHVEVVKLLLENQAQLEAASDGGWTPLNSAAESGHVEVVKLLLEKQAKIDY